MNLSLFHVKPDLFHVNLRVFHVNPDLFHVNLDLFHVNLRVFHVNLDLFHVNPDLLLVNLGHSSAFSAKCLPKRNFVQSFRAWNAEYNHQRCDSNGQ